MKTTIYSMHKFEEPYIIQANNGKHQLKLLEIRLMEETAVLVRGSTGFDHLDLKKNIEYKKADLIAAFTRKRTGFPCFFSKSIPVRESNHSTLWLMTIHI